MKRNVFIDRIAYRFGDASDLLREAADGLNGNEALTLKGLAELRRAADDARRNLRMVDAIVEHFEVDLLTPGGTTSAAVADRNAARAEAMILSTVQAALAGEVRP